MSTPQERKSPPPGFCSACGQYTNNPAPRLDDAVYCRECWLVPDKTKLCQIVGCDNTVVCGRHCEHHHETVCKPQRAAYIISPKPPSSSLCEDCHLPFSAMVTQSTKCLACIRLDEIEQLRKVIADERAQAAEAIKGCNASATVQAAELRQERLRAEELETTVAQLREQVEYAHHNIDLMDPLVPRALRAKPSDPSPTLQLTPGGRLERYRVLVEHEQEKRGSLIKELKKEVDDLSSSFDRRAKADQRAIIAWSKGHPERKLVMPDHVDLCNWLAERVMELRKALEGAVTQMAHDRKEEHGGALFECKATCSKCAAEKLIRETKVA